MPDLRMTRRPVPLRRCSPAAMADFTLSASSGWPPVNAARGFYIGELLKWVWVIGAFWLALTRGGFDPLPLLVGLVAAQLGFWVAIGIFKS